MEIGCLFGGHVHCPLQTTYRDLASNLGAGVQLYLFPFPSHANLVIRIAG